MVKPTGNNVLVEVTREYASVSHSSENEDMQSGILVDWHVAQYHLTASAAIKFTPEFVDNMNIDLSSLSGKEVRWEQYAEGGQTFEEDGKTYALVPWWRLIAYED